MLTFPPTTRVFVCREPTDMRKSFDGLMGLVISTLEQDPQSGHLFCFFNRRRTLVKILFWDRTGFVLFYKRLEKGTFAIFDQATGDASSFQVSAADLSLILEGIDLRGARRRKRYSSPRKGREFA